jgi:hypothetical protein
VPHLTHEKMLELLQTHSSREYARDLDGTMATVGPDPLWEFHPLGLRLTTRDAVREAYRLQFEHLFPHLAGATERTRAYGDDFIVAEQVIRLDQEGRQSDSCMTALLAFDDRYVTSERVYVSGPLTDVLERAFDGAFRELPGVVDLRSGPCRS